MPEAMALHKDFVDSLLELHQQKRSGVLRISHGTMKKQLVILSGNVAAAESNQPEEHLAQVLYRMRLLTRIDMATVTKWMKAGKPTEEAVLATEKLDAGALQKGALEQAVCVTASLLLQTALQMRFYLGEGLVRRNINLGIPIPELIVLSARRAAAERWLPVSLTKFQGRVQPAGNESGLRWNLPLDPTEAYAFSIVRDSVAVSDFLARLPSGSVDPQEHLFRLLLLGLLEREQEPVPATEPAQETVQADQLDTRVTEMLQRFEIANHYEILGLPVDTSEDQIKSAYHDLAKEFHPDRFQSKDHTVAFRTKVEKLFTYVTGAYETLNDTAARATYDQTRLREESSVETTLKARAGAKIDNERMAEGLFKAARLSYSNRDYEQAVMQLNECVWLRPEVSRYQYYLGLAQAEIPRLRKEAEHHFLKAIELDPSENRSRLALARVYIAALLPRRAESQLEAVLQWDSKSQEAQQLLHQLKTQR